jgi:RNA polymerase sigma-70 factor (ECF subfamily)
VQDDLNEQLKILIPRLRRFACGLEGSVDRGDELVQAACERLLNHRSRLRPDTRLDSWLYQVIRNLHVDGLRAQMVRDRGAQQITQAVESMPPSDGGLENRLLLHEVQAAMQRLPEEQRSALMLVAVEGFSYKEAAEVLQVPIGTVTSRLVRGRKALIALLDEGESICQLEVYK